MKIFIELPWGIKLISRECYTLEEGHAAVSSMPYGFSLISDEEAEEHHDAIEFPLVEENNNAGLPS
jgi:hypothetical protein